MDEQSKKTLDAILTKDLHELTPEDKGFLKARWHYVGKNSRAKFQSIFDEKVEEQHQEEAQNEGEKKDTNSFPPTEDGDEEDEESTTTGTDQNKDDDDEE